jgi:hypothetical protein
MKTLRLFIPGKFEDAQLYMGHLVVFTTERDVHMIEVQRLTNRLENLYPDWEGLLTLAFARNDWLGGGVMKSLMRNPRFRGALDSALDEATARDLVLERSDVEWSNLSGFRQNADLVLDTVFYGSRLYLGTTAGLFDYAIDWQSTTTDAPRRRIDARCVSAAAEYGAINASCEADGLFTGYDEFGWRRANNLVEELAQTAPKSIRSAWLGTDLVNYEDQAAPELLRGSVEQVAVEDEFTERQKKVVTAFSPPVAQFDDFYAGLEAQRGIPADDIQFVWNSSTRYFINTYNNGFYSAYRTSDGVGFTKHGTADGRVVAVHTSAFGWIVETDFRCYLMSQGRLHALVDREPLSVRTFAGSKRYRRVVAITVEDGVYLVSAVPSSV